MKLRNTRLWSRRTDGIILGVVAGCAALGWIGYAWVWPECIWHFRTKPDLLKTLAEVGGPSLEQRRLEDPAPFEFKLEYERLRVSSPVALRADKRLGIKGEGFRLRISEDLSDETPLTSMLGPLTVTAANVRAASTEHERQAAIKAVVTRSWYFGESSVNDGPAQRMFDRSVLVESPGSKVVFKSGPKIISGVVCAKDYSEQHDFILVLEGMERQVAEEIAANLRIAGPR